ncbi:MAG: U32 family peptidase [Bacillus subtilis]|nr:U32 family peptidase [Bacillus subtilis]
MIEIVAPAGDLRSLSGGSPRGNRCGLPGSQVLQRQKKGRQLRNPRSVAKHRLLRERGIRSYLTLNTVLFDDELQAVVRLLEELIPCPPDAIIFQDLALTRIVAQILPDVSLHASTQVGISTLDGLRFVQESGRKARRDRKGIVLSGDLLPRREFSHRTRGVRFRCDVFFVFGFLLCVP